MKFVENGITKHLELTFANGRVFLNYWDCIYGNDICVEIIKGQIVEDGVILTLEEYIEEFTK
jgi:hypothetical protein